MKISDLVNYLESVANPSLQEHYDNAGLLTGDASWDCHGALITLDVTEEVVHEAIQRKSNLIIAHHPIIFGGLKKITGKNYVEKTVIASLKNDIAIYAIHTNLDNVIHGVNGRIAAMLGLINKSILFRKENALKKLFTFVPVDKAGQVRDALFEAGAGQIGNYDECSFNAEGTGTFRAGEETNPYTGEKGKRHYENEMRIEVIFPSWLEHKLVNALLAAHPYEEVAFDIVSLSNSYPQAGSGITGELQEPVEEREFLTQLRDIFKTTVIRHTKLLNKPVKKVAVCGGAGSFLISKALAAGADFYITADVKYHEFFDAGGQMVIADIGHFESEQFTINLLKELLEQKFPTFAVLKTGVNTNPVHYFV